MADQSFDPSDPRSATTFPQFVRATATAYGDEIAITLTGETVPSEALTFRELDQRSATLAKALLARGVGKCSRVGFIYGNSPGFALWLAAITRIGAIAVPISTLIKANELVRVLRQSDIVGLIVQHKLLGHDLVERTSHALPELAGQTAGALRMVPTPYLRWIVSSGEALPPAIEDLAAFTAAADGIADELLEAAEAEVHSTDQMVEIYTSGSMALPKGVKHLHGPVLFRTRYLADMTGRAHGMETPVPLPMFWVGGMGLFLLPNWLVGARTACTESTVTNSLSAMGTVLSEDDLAKASYPPPYWGLGMSETFGPYTYGDVLRAPGYPLCAPLDHVADRYEVRVADAQGRPVGDGETGEIQVRGYALTPGLHKLERSGYFTADGFYHTGDLGLVEGSRIHFVGRDGDMIKTAGSNVSPAEVEMEMQQLEGVHSAYVVGLPDQERGQLLVAAVVPREGAVLDFEAMQKELRQKLSSYKVPRGYIQISRDEVPMLPSNKVARRQIEALMAERLGRASAAGGQ